MADFTSMLNNPWVLHLQRLELELQCPLCLKLLNRPVLLPCDHIFCDSCIHVESSCAVCKSKHTKTSRRNLQFMENVISIYKSLNAAVTRKDGGVSDDSKMIDKGGIKRSGSDSSFRDEFESEIDASNRTPESENGLTDHTKAQKHQLPESQTEQGVKRKCDITSSEARENHQKVPKRQKNLVQKAADIDFNDSYSANSDDQLVTKTLKSTDFLTLSRNIPICEFCQSANVSLATGDMLHYSRRRPVVGYDSFGSSVIHVHSACVEWAPQVYFEGDVMKNLKPELARGMKIKCTKCGLKGAALGCYVKSCPKSYHVPCAREIPKCRWDHRDFLLLCPSHSSVKFPSEKSGPKAAPHYTPYSPFRFGLQKTNSVDLVFCGSALSQGDKRLMEKLAVKFNATISRYWNSSVTHVIASTDEKGACTRTMKVLMGILNGKWIVSADWLHVSFEASQPVDEEPFEIHIDTEGCEEGPRTARLRAATNKPKLFDSLNFYFYGDFIKGYKEDLQNLVKVGGGKILNTQDELSSESSNNIVVYSIDPPIGCALDEEVAVIGERANEAEALSTKTGSQVVGHTWLLESIAGYKLLPMAK